MPFIEGGKPGPGRPKGLQNQKTLLQRQFAERILGVAGSPEENEYIASQRKLLLAGELHPAIHTTLLHYKHGKPTEVIEIEGEVALTRVVREVVDTTVVDDSHRDVPSIDAIH